MFEIQLMYTLVILLAFSSSLAFGAFWGWFLFERKNAPFRKDTDDTVTSTDVEEE